MLTLTASQLHELANALQGLTDQTPLWANLKQYVADTISDANENTTDLVTTAEQRHWWAGHERALRDLWSDLEALRSGAYRQWPTLRALPKEEQGDES